MQPGRVRGTLAVRIALVTTAVAFLTALIVAAVSVPQIRSAATVEAQQSLARAADSVVNSIQPGASGPRLQGRTLVRLRNGAGTLQIPTWVTSIQIGVQKGRWSGPGTQSQIVYQYVGETPGLPVSYKRARTSRGGYMCIAPTPGLVINARAVLRTTKRYKGWRKDPLVDKKEVLVWATPTLQGKSTYNRYQEDSPLAAQRGLIGVQNTVCGEKYD